MKKAFTLVELIVVIFILAIVGTISFLSYQNYLSNARDGNRDAQLQNLHKGLELYLLNKQTLPVTQDGIIIKGGGKTLGSQGYAGKDVFLKLGLTKNAKDFESDEYFTYYITPNKRYYQLLGLFEKREGINSFGFITKSYALNNINKTPLVYGNPLGILLDINNTPIQKMKSQVETSSGILDLDLSGDTFKAFFKNNNFFIGTGSLLTREINNFRN